MNIHYDTREGYEKLKKELADAIAQRPVISAAIAEARDKGDLSENAEYEAAREAQGILEARIVNLKDQVASARVIDESQIGTEKVQMLNNEPQCQEGNGVHPRGRERGGFRRRKARCDHSYRQGPHGSQER